MRKYEEAMERIRVTDEMKARVLRGIRQADPAAHRSSRAVRAVGTRRLAALAACLAVVLTGALALPRLMEPSGPDVSGVQLPGGIVEAASAEELSRLAGFQIRDLDDIPFAPEQAAYTLFGDLAQIDYRAGEARLIYRKAPGTGDISGDYTPYGQETTADVGGVAVTLRGDGGLYRLAVWSEGDYAYSLSSTAGLSQERWQEMISCILEQNA